ncbi:MAG: hypothetical protein H0U90_06740 [Actinobacteria bacterium]|nr:hypothetical protein [Actinomycetota bacterium]
MRDPGLDRHNWQTEWEQLEDDLKDAPAETLPEIGDLVERMLRERRFPLDDAVADDGIELEVLANYRSAREITTQVERGENVDPAEIGQAIHNFRDIYEQLIDRPDN